MKKSEKTALVEDLSSSFGRASIALVSEYRGMTAAESTEMRKRLRAVRGEMRIAKNTLVRHAIKGTRFEALDSNLGGKLKLRSAVLDGKTLTPAEVQALATLPSREVVFGQLLGLLNAPATQLVRLLNEPGSYLARVIDAIGKKNGDKAPAAAPETASSEPAPEAPAAPETPAAPAGG